MHNLLFSIKRILKVFICKLNVFFVVTPRRHIFPKYLLGHNKFGKYCLPLSSIDRPAVKMTLNGQVYELETLEFIQKLNLNGDIIHAGSFFGDFLPALANSVSDTMMVWAFEPNFENYYCALHTRTINNLENVILINGALGNKNHLGQIQVSDQGKSLGGKSKITKSSHAHQNAETIPIFSLDNIIPHDRKISLIHLDVEGYEQQVIVGSIKIIRKHKPLLILEDNNDFISSIWFKENIAGIGYSSIYKINYNHVFKVN